LNSQQVDATSEVILSGGAAVRWGGVVMGQGAVTVMAGSHKLPGVITAAALRLTISDDATVG
jgi:hypothetical protein